MSCKYKCSGRIMLLHAPAVALSFCRQAADLRHVDFTTLQPFACTFQKNLIVLLANVNDLLVKV